MCKENNPENFLTELKKHNTDKKKKKNIQLNKKKKRFKKKI